MRAGAHLSGAFALLVSRELWSATTFLLLSSALGILWFSALLALVSAGAALAITVVGLPFLAVVMRVWIAGAARERARVAALLDSPILPPYRPLPDGTLIARARARAGDPAVWRDLLYLLLLFPIGIAEGVLVLYPWSLALSCLTAPAYYLLGPSDPFLVVPGVFVGSLPAALLAALAGLALAILIPRLVIGAARAHAALAQWLLGPSRRTLLAARVDALSESRSRLVDTMLLERRRIERDLHDGAQQRLVTLAMGLGIAREKMEADPEVARALVAEAHEEAKRAIREIRDLVRGIHPAVLSDRGLDAAISALAGRCPIPVAVTVELHRRLPEPVESAAYFVVAEALTNVAKHANAAQASVTVDHAGDRLVVKVADNGIGGADPQAGFGLAGLIDRVAALDGRLTVESPAGGPTRVRAELPCGS
jgi:signal transduction histidine kinase